MNKTVLFVVLLLVFVQSGVAQSNDWKDWPDGGEINCLVVQQMIYTYGRRTLFRGVPDVDNFTVKLMFDEVFSVCKSTQTTSRSTTSSVRNTPTPKPAALDDRTIRSLVSRYTKDIRILDLKISSSATTIEYDLKPWPFVPNEQIAEEVAFKIICAIRKGGKRFPNTLKLIGQSHFKTDLGRKFTSPSVEIHIGTRTSNGLVCQGNSYNDISWRRVSSRYKSYPIPKGAKVDYD